MCCSIEVEKKYKLCFDRFIKDYGDEYGPTIYSFLLKWNIVVTDEGEFGRRFLDFLEQADKDNLIIPVVKGEQSEPCN